MILKTNILKINRKYFYIFQFSALFSKWIHFSVWDWIIVSSLPLLEIKYIQPREFDKVSFMFIWFEQHQICFVSTNPPTHQPSNSPQISDLSQLAWHSSNWLSIKPGPCDVFSILIELFREAQTKYIDTLLSLISVLLTIFHFSFSSSPG